MSDQINSTTKERKKSNSYHYISILIFGFFFSMFLYVYILNKPVNSYYIGSYLGSGCVILFFGFLFTRWGSRTAGWLAVIIVSFLMYLGT